jgi:DNA-directed RNA polymerase specialized sigma54-like protein
MQSGYLARSKALVEHLNVQCVAESIQTHDIALRTLFHAIRKQYLAAPDQGIAAALHLGYLHVEHCAEQAHGEMRSNRAGDVQQMLFVNV